MRKREGKFQDKNQVSNTIMVMQLLTSKSKRENNTGYWLVPENFNPKIHFLTERDWIIRESIIGKSYQ